MTDEKIIEYQEFFKESNKRLDEINPENVYPFCFLNVIFLSEYFTCIKPHF